MQLYIDELVKATFFVENPTNALVCLLNSFPLKTTIGPIKGDKIHNRTPGFCIFAKTPLADEKQIDASVSLFPDALVE